MLASVPTALGAFLDSGTGSPANPYHIASADDLDEFAREVAWGQTFRGRYVVLDTDLDLSGHSGFTPIGICGDEAATSASFQGHFDGLFHTISGLEIIADEEQPATGLFASIDGGGSVCNLRLAPDCYVSGNTNVGMLAGKVWDGDIIFCSNHGRVNGQSRAGGLVGDIKAGTIHGCSNHGAVETSQAGAGGIIGRADGHVSVSGCYNTAHISARRPGACAGIAAMAYSAADFAACYNTGIITGKYSEAFEISPAPIASDIPELIWTGSIDGCCYITPADGLTQPGATEFTRHEMESQTAVDFLNDHLPPADGTSSLTLLTYPFADTVYTLPPANFNGSLPVLGWELRGYAAIGQTQAANAARLEINGTTVRAADGRVIQAYAPTGNMVDRGVTLDLPQGFYIVEGQKVLIR